MKLALTISTMGAGGAERVAALLSSGWAAAGREVSIITINAPGAASFYPLHPNVKLVDASVPPGGRLAVNLRRVRALRAALREERPDAVISFLDQTNVLTQLAASFLGIPVIVTEHIDPRQYSPGRAWELLRRALYPSAAALVCVSRGVLEGFPPELRRNARVIYNPLAPRPAPGRTAARPGGRSTLISVGRLTRQKGFDLLLEAFSRVSGARPGWDLEIWGEGPDREQLLAQARALGVQDRVRLPGLTDNVPARLLAADLFALSSRFEGFGIVLCEAMDCGLPVVSFDCPSGPSEIIEHGRTGLLVPAGDAGALASGLAELMDDAALRARLGAAARDSAAKFGADRVLGDWERLFSGLSLAPGGRP